jgi:glycine cleavage system H protein
VDPEKLRYAESHEWALLEDGIVTVGITEYAVNEVGDIVFIEFEAEDRVTKGEPFGILETVKAVFDLNAPVSGTIEAKNEQVEDDPEIVQNDPVGRGWILKIKADDPSELDSLMDLEAYTQFIDKN